MPEQYRKSWENVVKSEEVYERFIERLQWCALIGGASLGLSLTVSTVVWLRAITGDLGCIG
ncbi:MAG: hypothetical protein PHT19_01540 [Methylococcus sp.]|nr:hypothetical protein [Methylococcus sp.]